MGIVTRKDEVTKLRVFTGVVVESIERINTFTNAEQWAWVIYNRDTGTFAMPDAVNNIEPTSRGYDNSGIKKRLDALNAVGFDEYNVGGFEGVEAKFRPYETTFDGKVFTKMLPFERIGQVSTEELSNLKKSLAEIRSKAQADKAANNSQHIEQAPEFSPDETATLVGLYDGHSDEEAQALAARSGLSTAVKNLVMTGGAAQYLVGVGLLGVDEEGRYLAAVTA